MKELGHFDYLKGWIMFLLLSIIGGVLARLASLPVVPLSTMLGASENQLELALFVVRFVVGFTIWYIAFRFVVRRFLGPKMSDADPTSKV
jgi:hypothetical protein